MKPIILCVLCLSLSVLAGRAIGAGAQQPQPFPRPGQQPARPAPPVAPAPAPPATVAPPAPEATPTADPQRLQMALSVPAMGLLLSGILALTVNVMVLVIVSIRETHFAGEPAANVVWLFLLCGPASVAAASVQIVGAVRMLQHKAYATAVASSLVAMIPWTPVWVVSLPLGIIALVLLRKLAVVELFIQKKSRPDAGEHAEEDSPAAPTWRVHGFLRSMAGYFLTSPSRRSGDESSTNGQESLHEK